MIRNPFFEEKTPTAQRRRYGKLSFSLAYAQRIPSVAVTTLVPMQLAENGCIGRFSDLLYFKHSVLR